MEKTKIVELEGEGHRLMLIKPVPSKQGSYTPDYLTSLNKNLERLTAACTCSTDQKLKKIGKTLTKILDGSIKESSTKKPFRVVELSIMEP
ncbi:MAG: hypothetical protein ACFFD4_11975 [Candidatus Odinarchaeota archaeon]